MRPRTPTAFLQIHGVGMAKLERSGETFLTVIHPRAGRPPA